MADRRAGRCIRRRAGGTGLPSGCDADRATACAGWWHLRPGVWPLVLRWRRAASPLLAQYRHLSRLYLCFPGVAGDGALALGWLSRPLGDARAWYRRALHGRGWLQLAIPRSWPATPLSAAQRAPALLRPWHWHGHVRLHR